ncbi:MAG: hypothetical protein JRJ57_00230 [Deltaproteobacteria bacterium]|nr:hypothetical protein [Deltaproteobacteria bacterium]
MAKLIKVKILKPVAGAFGLAYFPDDVTELEQKQATTLIKAGYATTVEEGGDLPKDIPGRRELIKAGVSYDELQKITDLESIEGIGAATAKKISEYLIKAG